MALESVKKSKKAAFRFRYSAAFGISCLGQTIAQTDHELIDCVLIIDRKFRVVSGSAADTLEARYLSIGESENHPELAWIGNVDSLDQTFWLFSRVVNDTRPVTDGLDAFVGTRHFLGRVTLNLKVLAVKKSRQLADLQVRLHDDEFPCETPSPWAQ